MSADDDVPRSSLALYRTEDGRTRIQCRFEGETLWLTQALMAELFQIAVPTVNEHLKALLAEGEIDAAATIRSFRVVRTEGRRQVSREIEHYSLPVILAVGYRVRDLLALAVDYRADEIETHRLFQVVQNKRHNAVTV